MKKEKSWAQIWANYYGHITRNLTDIQTHSVLLQERAIQEAIITRAEEHLEGVAFFYRQSTLTDPHPPGKIKKGSNSLSDDHSDTIAKDPSRNTPNSTRELSDRRI